MLGDGAVWCWGCGPSAASSKNQCLIPDGAGATCALVPVMVPDIAGAKAVTTSTDFNCALLRDGTVRWWEMPAGPLDPTPNGLSGIDAAVAIAGGIEHACAVLEDGSVWCWAFQGDAVTAPARVPGF